MKGEIRAETICGYPCSVYLPAEYGDGEARFPVAYLNGANGLEEIAEEIEPETARPFLLIGISSESWSDELTPWPAPPLRPGDKPFGGNAEEYLGNLTRFVKPYVDAHYLTRPEPERTALAGYSLGGLTALFALYRDNAFGRIGSMSGSLWFDGWLSFMASLMPRSRSARVYLSLGKGESKSRNARMAQVGACTLKASVILKEQLCENGNLKFEWNDGGHFSQIPRRIARGLCFLMQNE